MRSPLSLGGGSSPAVLLKVPAQLHLHTHTHQSDSGLLSHPLTSPHLYLCCSQVYVLVFGRLGPPRAIECEREWELLQSFGLKGRQSNKHAKHKLWQPFKTWKWKVEIISSTLITMKHTWYLVVPLWTSVRDLMCTSTFSCTAQQGKPSILQDASQANVHFPCDWVSRSAASEETLRNVF